MTNSKSVAFQNIRDIESEISPTAAYSIRSTAEIAGRSKAFPPFNKKIFRKFTWRSAALSTLLFVVILTVAKILPVQSLPKHTLESLLFLAAAAAWGFIDPERKHNIIVGVQGLAVGDKTYKWEDISDTAILTDHTKSNAAKYLVIVSGDVYEKIPLDQFNYLKTGGISRKLAEYIEHFKNKKISSGLLFKSSF